MKVKVLSPEKIIFEGEASSVLAPGVDGLFGVLPNHAPMISELGKGNVALRLDNEEKSFEVVSGFLQVVNNEINVLLGQ